MPGEPTGMPGTARPIASGAEPYDALKTAADNMTEYRKEVLRQWTPLAAEAAV